MTTDQAFIFLLLAATLGLFVWGRWRYDLVALAALLVVALRGWVARDDIFSGFGHPAVITVAAVLVLSKGLLNAGVVDAIARGLARMGGGQTAQIVMLTTFTAACSAFMNNVGALALMMPVAVWMARRGGYSPSRVLMPLAFGSLLGGMTTLIGTPPNIIIASFRRETGNPPFAMFDFLPSGLVVMVAGIAVIAWMSRRLVPERVELQDDDLFGLHDYVTEVLVPEESKVVGQTIHDLEELVGEDVEVTVLRLIRNGKRQSTPSPYVVLKANDILLVEANPDDLSALLDKSQLKLAESRDDGEGSLEPDNVRTMEVIISRNSPLLGKTAAALDLRQRFKVNVLGVARHGQRIRQRLSQVRFLLGDILLLQGGEDELQRANGELRCLPLADRDLQLGKPRKFLLAAAVFGTAIAVAAAGWLPAQLALTAAAVAMIVVRVLSLSDAYEAVDWPILVLLAAMMPVGQAFENTGAAQWLANHVSAMSAWGGLWVALPVLMIGTMLLSDVVNNAAAAVLMAPIALRIASGMDVSADALLMGVAIGASAAFLTPIGHQSNTLVMEPGGYRFGDYWRLGLAIELAAVAVATPVIIWVWG